MDLAFLLDEKAHKADPFRATGRVYMTAMRIGTKFGREMDVVILNSSSIELAYEAGNERLLCIRSRPGQED